MKSLVPIVKLVTLGVVFFGATCAGRAQCSEPSAEVQNRAAVYAAKRFHVDPGHVRIASMERSGSSCYWALHLVAGSNSGLTLYLSPDFQYLVPDLYDLAKDPLDEEKRADEAMQARLMARHSPERGTTAPVVTIVEFADLQCPYCKNLNETLKALEASGSLADVRIVFKNFLIPSHDWSETAALVGECARLQDESLFWKYHDFVFGHQESIDATSILSTSGKFLQTAGAHGLDLNRCVSDPRTKLSVREDMELGKTVGIRVTPTFFVNGRKYEGAKSASEIQSIIAATRLATTRPSGQVPVQ